MVVSFPRAVRALLEAHVRTAFNAGLRNAGIGVTALALAVALLLWLGFLVPVCLASALAGFKLAGEPRAFALVSGAVFLFMPLFGGVVSLMTGDGQELDLDKLEPYPVPPAALFAAELVASFVNPVMAIAAGMQTAFALGALLSGAAGAWPVAFALATGLSLQAGARALVAAVADRLVRRAQGVLVVLLAVLPVALLAALKRLGEKRVDAGVESVAALFRFLPSALQLQAPSRWAAGAHGEAALWLAGPLAVSALVLVLAMRLARRDLSGGVARQATGPATLWSYRSPVTALARVQLSALWATELGRFSLFLPAFWLVFIPLRAEAPELSLRPDLVALFIWVLLPTMLATFTLNQFGLDRGAVKALFLLPLDETQLLYGKSLGLGLVLLVQCSAAALLVGLLVPQSPAFLLAGPALALTIGGLHLLIGQWTSVAWPRPIPRRGLRQPPGSLLVGLVTLATLFGTALPLGALWWALGGTSPWALAAVLLGLAGAVAALHRVFTPLAAQAVAHRRERLVESLS